MAGANGITAKSGGSRVAGVAKSGSKSPAVGAKLSAARKGMTQFVEGRYRVPVGQKIRL